MHNVGFGDGVVRRRTLKVHFLFNRIGQPVGSLAVVRAVVTDRQNTDDQLCA